MLEKKGGGKVSTIRTREDWLNEFVRESRPVFRDRGFTVPDLVRVSIGFTSKGKKSKAIGECWNAEASRDRHFEIFIHPGLLGNRSRVADVVTHEVCHTIVPEAKHGQPFKRVAIAIGLVGKMTETEAGPKWHDWADPIVEGLGEIPGSELNCQSPTRAKEARGCSRQNARPAGSCSELRGNGSTPSKSYAARTRLATDEFKPPNS